MNASTKASAGVRLLAGARRLVGASLVLGALVIGLVVLVPALLGYQRYVIVSGSMTGTYDRGSIVFDRVVPTASLKAGDVITFTPPGQAQESAHGTGLVTHRIKAIKVVHGQRVYTTKGDHNSVADAWSPMTLHGRQQAVVHFSVPYVGFAIAALSERKLRMIIIGVPAMLIALMTLAALWKDTGESAPPGRLKPGAGEP